MSERDGRAVSAWMTSLRTRHRGARLPSSSIFDSLALDVPPRVGTATVRPSHGIWKASSVVGVTAPTLRDRARNRAAVEMKQSSDADTACDEVVARRVDVRDYEDRALGGSGLGRLRPFPNAIEHADRVGIT